MRPAGLGGHGMRLDGDVADARGGPAALHREVADVGAELEHRVRVRQNARHQGRSSGLPALLAAPVELLEDLRVDGDELEVRVVDQAEARHRTGDAAPEQPPQQRPADPRRHRRPGARREGPAERVGDRDGHRTHDGPGEPSSGRTHRSDV